MPVFHDPALDEIATKKCDLGARHEIKRHADHVRVTGDADVVIRTWQEADKEGSLRDGFNLTFVRIPQALVYFYKPIHEVVPLIESAQPKVKGKVVSKVIVKMIARRINDVMVDIHSHNESQLNSYNFRKANPNYAGNTNVTPPVPFVINGDIDTKEKLEAEFIRWSGVSNWNGVRSLRHLRKDLLSKPELTDQDVKEAWNLVLAGQVMKE